MTTRSTAPVREENIPEPDEQNTGEAIPMPAVDEHVVDAEEVTPVQFSQNEVTLPDGRVMSSEEYQQRLALCRKPFSADELEVKPQQVKKDDQDWGYCNRGSNYSADGVYCGKRHARSVHLDYVGHAGITDRLNQVDPMWNWEPMAYTPTGTPLFSDNGMWGKLTVLGVTRIGFGDPGRSQGANGTKELIGDFLRNAAMRFGIGTYLWSKSQLAAQKKLGELETTDEDNSPWKQPTQAQQPDWVALIRGAANSRDMLLDLLAKAQGMNAPTDVISDIQRAGMALDARSTGNYDN